MEKKLFTILFSVISTAAICQERVTDSTINLNLLQAPSSPAFSLLDVAPSSIETPTDLNAFKLSIQNATNNLTQFPSNYAVDLAPAALFNSKNQTLNTFNSNQHALWQSLNISFGLIRSDSTGKETDDTATFTKIAVGLKFSIIRPKWNEATETKANLLTSAAEKLNAITKNIISEDAELKRLDMLIKNTALSTLPSQQKIDSIKALNVLKGERKIILFQQQQNNMLLTDSFRNQIKVAANDFEIQRKGIFLDFASGMVLDFPGNKFNNSMVSKAGAWLTGGYENDSNFSALAIARYLYQPDKIFADDNGTISTANISTFDAGAKLSLKGANGKFLFSFEALYRSVLNKHVIDPSWRAVLNASYDIGFNKIITLALGRNFDGTITKDGNLIAAINFIAGFGSTKKLTKSNL